MNLIRGGNLATALKQTTDGEVLLQRGVRYPASGGVTMRSGQRLGAYGDAALPAPVIYGGGINCAGTADVQIDGVVIDGQGIRTKGIQGLDADGLTVKN